MPSCLRLLAIVKEVGSSDEGVRAWLKKHTFFLQITELDLVCIGLEEMMGAEEYGGGAFGIGAGGGTKVETCAESIADGGGDVVQV